MTRHPRWTPVDGAARLATYRRNASAQAVADGRAWYPHALAVCQAVARVTGRDVTAVVHACAALSPMVPWSQNIAMLKTLAARRTYANPGTFPKMARDGWACLGGDLGRCSGPKREAFARAILGDMSAIVIDRWMLRALGAPDYSPHVTQMPRYVHCVRIVADCLDLESARDFQAVVWCAIRNDVTPLSER